VFHPRIKVFTAEKSRISLVLITVIRHVISALAPISCRIAGAEMQEIV